MKKINRIFRATKKDGSFQNVLSKLPENPNDYSGIFTDIDKVLIDRVLKGLSECDEDMHPAMFIPLSYFFLKSPAQAKEEFDMPMGAGTLLEKFIQESFNNVEQWLYWNEELSNELFALCSGVQRKNVNAQSIEMSNVYITPQIEEDFLKRAGDNNISRIKRIKVLAAIHILLLKQPLNDSMESADAKLSAYFMFLFCRSLAQFSANRVVDIGLSLLKSTRKGGGEERDRKGLLTFIADYHAKFQGKTDEELWGIIKANMQQKKFAKPCPGYSVTFYDDYVNQGKRSGTLIQKNKEGVEYPIQYKAFTAIRGELRK